MRWYVKPIPVEGELREVAKFAYFPTKVGNAIIWLETFYAFEEYRKVVDSIDHGYVDWEFRWVEIRRFLNDRR
jgi:thiamine pyrophosphate-dependent acetolactate synthase large subunit-like protein